MIFSFFNCSSLCCFLLIKFHFTFSVSYKITPWYITFWLGSDRLSTLFFCAHCTSFHTRASCLIFFCFLILFHSHCSHAWVFGKTIMHEFISFSLTEWCLFFFGTVQLQVQNVYLEWNTRNSWALVNMNHLTKLMGVRLGYLLGNSSTASGCSYLRVR